jgi:aldehyde dehydrogenase (NAD+)
MNDNIEVNVSTDRILEVFIKQKEYSKTVRKTKRGERVRKLRKLKKAILDHREDIQKAIYDDFKRHPLGSDILDVFTNIEEIKIAIRNLSRWMNKSSVHSSIFLIGSSSWTKFEPRGVTLIIAPWNLPVNLSIGPLISAVAAGNTAIIKPSEFTPNASKVIKKIVKEVFEEKEVYVVEGDWKVGDYLTDLPFDFIYFTGSTKVGKIIAEKAGKKLIPSTIELGGKTPVIIDKSANLSLAVGRIVTAKFLNNGQICLAPDYALVHESILDEFVEECKKAVTRAFGKDPQRSPSYCRLVTDGQVEKMQTL